MGDTNISYEPESFRTNPIPKKPKNGKNEKEKENNNTQTVVIDVHTSKGDDVEAQKEKNRNKNPPFVNRGLPIFGMSKVTFCIVVVIILMTVGNVLCDRFFDEEELFVLFFRCFSPPNVYTCFFTQVVTIYVI